MSEERFNYKIRWYQIPIEFVNLEEFTEKLNQQTGPKTPPKPGCKHLTLIREFNWNIDPDGVLEYFDPEIGWYRRIKFDPNANQENSSPMENFKIVRAMIKKEMGKPMSDIWGCAKKGLWGFVKCVPSQISWFNMSMARKPLDQVYKADVSSAFPYEACKRLPTLIDHKIVYSYDVQPTEEYPFVFFNNGRLMFLEEDGTIVDTQTFGQYYNWEMASLNYRNRRMQYDYPTYEQDCCLCCKAGPSLKSVMEEIYEQKKRGDKNAKFLMNTFIGYCWRKRQPSYFHLAAVIIARCDNRMVEMARRLLDRGETPLLIATDSIMWNGKDDEMEQLVKIKGGNTQLGDLCWEAYDAETIITGSKCYQIRHSNGKVKTTWSGISKSESEKAQFGDVLNGTEYEWYAQDIKTGQIRPI